MIFNDVLQKGTLQRVEIIFFEITENSLMFVEIKIKTTKTNQFYFFLFLIKAN